MTRKEAPEKQNELLEGFLAEKELQIIWALITAREGAPPQGLRNTSGNPNNRKGQDPRSSDLAWERPCPLSKDPVRAQRKRETRREALEKEVQGASKGAGVGRRKATPEEVAQEQGL